MAHSLSRGGFVRGEPPGSAEVAVGRIANVPSSDVKPPMEESFQDEKEQGQQAIYL